VLRESQSAALALPNTGQAVAIDIGEAHDIHPRNKQDVGLRLALAARHVTFGENVEYSGPVYRRHVQRDGRIVIDFDHLSGGLVARGADNRVQGFAISGADQRFVWANAVIEGDRLVVWSEQVPDPVAVRYAWADNPEGANLFNRAGLPASPFRTDDWR
jgi:sialate O-acetylesterase